MRFLNANALYTLLPRSAGFSMKLVSALFLLGLASSTQAQMQIELAQGNYTITDLGVLTSQGDTDSSAVAISKNGTVVGISGIYLEPSDDAGFVGYFNTDAFVWTPTTPNGTTGNMIYAALPGDTCMLPDHTVGGLTTPAHMTTYDTALYDINSIGQAVGLSWTSSSGFCDNGQQDGMLVLNAAVQDLSAPPQILPSPPLYGLGVEIYSEADAINDAGLIAGTASGKGFEQGSVWLYDGSYHLLGLVPNSTITIPSKINSKGTIVGYSDAGGFVHTGFGPLQASDVLGDLGGGQGSEAYGINDAGMVVGYTSVLTTSNGVAFHALLIDQNGLYHDLGTLSADPTANSFASAINNSGHDVVGTSDIVVTASNAFVQPQHAVLWASGGRPADLNLLLDPAVVVSKSCPNCWELVSANGINDIGQIVGEGYNGGFRHAFLLTPKCINDGGDTDGDGLCDNWEKYGYTDPKSGEFVNLPAMGAHWDHKDIFVQADYMVDSTIEICTPPYVCSYAHTHKPNPDGMAMVINAFANAPVENPDGFTGINIHIDCGRDCVMNPETGETWGDYSLAQAIDPEITLLGDQLDDSCMPIKAGDCAYDWTEFNTFRDANFVPTGRAASFHYMIFAHTIGVFAQTTKKDGSKGIGIANATGIGDIPDSNFIVSLGAESGQVGKRLQQAGTFMHELGHNLGLHHGGGDDLNGKPNYLSVMNYSFQDGLITNGVRNAIDYSKFYQIPSLNEYSLNEKVGLNGGPLTANYGTFYYCYVIVPVTGGTIYQQQTRFVPNANSPIDWNCNGTIDPTTLTDGYDLDGLTDQYNDPVLTNVPLAGAEDWSHLIFAGGAVGQLGESSGNSNLGHQAAEGPVPFLQTPYDVEVVSPGLAFVSPGASITNFTYTITNTGLQPDTYNLTTSSQYSDWWNVSGVPASIGLAAGASQQITIPVTIPSTFGCSNLNTVQATFLLQATSQTYPTLSESGAAELDLVPTPGTVTVPTVVGLTQSAAQTAITSAGFVIGAISTQSSTTVPSGTVISQTPVGCAFAGAGTGISIVVSTGPALVATPNVVGNTQSQASASIASAGLSVGTITTVPSLSVPAGNVISETPLAGTYILAGAPVNLLVSTGLTPSTPVPNVVGEPLGTATTALGDAGLVLGTTTGTYSATVAAGAVLSETPSPGTLVPPGAAVNLTISTGSSAYAIVPNLIGDTQSTAIAAISSAGLLFGGTASVSSLTVPVGQVMGQTPLPGQFVFSGSTVTFTLSAGPQPYLVPDLYGLTQTVATSTLTAAGLTVGTVTPYPWLFVPPGQVFQQSQPAGTYVAAGTPIGFYIATASTDTVPDVSAMSTVQAGASILGAGLTIGSVTFQPSTTVSQGYFVSQTPTAGTVVAPEKPVNLVYSAGSRLFTVPNAVGESQTAATQLILNAFFYVSITRQPSTTVPDGAVISQSPAAGSQIPLYSIVNLVVSSGGPVVTAIPNVTGIARGFAEENLVEAGFAIGSVTYQPGPLTVPANYVISQSPAAGTLAPWDTSVSLVVASSGATQVTVPNLVGETQAGAIATLNPTPLSWTIITQTSSTVPAGEVISQSIPPGVTLVDNGISVGANPLISFVVSAGATPVPSYAYQSQFGDGAGPNSQDGEFGSASGIVVDPVSRNIIVGDEDGRIQIFDSNGNFLRYFGGYGIQFFGTLTFPYQIFFASTPAQNGLFATITQTTLAVDPVNHNIIALDLVGQRVMIFNSAGAFLTQFGSQGLGPGQFSFGLYAGVAIDPVTENIVISDFGNSRIQIFNSAGAYLGQFGTPGAGVAQLGNPAGIAIDPTTRNIVVADWGLDRVEVFNSSGGYVTQFGGPGAGSGKFYEPTFVAIDPTTHNIVVAASGIATAPQPYLQVFKSDGTYLTEFGGVGGGNGQFALGTTGIAIDPVSHNILVADSSRVEVFALAGGASLSTITLTSSRNPAPLGGSVTLTATVTGSNPTGTVQFQQGANNLAPPVPLTAGVATLTLSNLPVGTDSIVAVYGGDANNVTSSSAVLNEVISPYPAAASVASSLNPAVAGQAVTLTATVTGSKPTGTVVFLNGASSLSAAVALSGGVATFTTSTLPVGTDSITAVYSGDANNATSTSAVLKETVSLEPTTTTVLASGNYVTVGQPITFTAIVKGDSPTGTVQFLDGGSSLGLPVAMTGNEAGLTISTLAAGTHAITAVYSGDSFNATSTSPALNEVLSLNGATTTTLAASADPVMIGSPVTFTAKVTGSSPTGTIQFVDGATNLGSPVALSGSVAALTTSALSGGTHAITAVYSGDKANAAGTSAILSEVVSLNATTTTISASVNPAVVGQQITFTAKVTGNNPSGPILFLDGTTPLVPPLPLVNGRPSGKDVNPSFNAHSDDLTNGQASITLTTLAAGTHSITAVYNGDSSNGPSASAILNEVIQSGAAAPPVVTPPAGISIPATQANGATSSASLALAAFLAGATATSTLPAAPVQLAPQVGGLAVTGSTVFPLGTTTVTFSFKDANGNIGSATSTVTVAVGTPRITGTTAGIGSDPSGAIYVNVVLTNTGTGNAHNLQIKTLTIRTLSGTGTVTYDTTLSPVLPLTLGNLSVGASVTTKIYLNVPSTVTRISITESGPVQDVAGDSYNYSTAEGVVP